MKLIIFDFIRRYRWWIIGVSIGTVWLLLAGPAPGFLVLLGPVALGWDFMKGAAKVHATRPVSRKELANALWVCGVLLGPGLLACLTAFVMPMRLVIPPPPDAVLLPPHVTLLWGIGYAAMMMCLLPLLPQNRPAGLDWRYVVGVPASGLWGLCAGGVFFFTMLVQDGKISLEAWRIPFSLASVGFVVLSYLLRLQLVEGKLGGKAQARVDGRNGLCGRDGRAQSGRLVVQSRLRGFARPWLRSILLGLGVAVLVIIASLALRHQAGARVHPGRSEAIPEALVILGLISLLFLPTVSVAPWVGATLRALRSLPMSSARLTWYLLTFSAIPVVGCVAFLTLYVVAFRDVQLTVQVPLCAVGVLGVGLLGPVPLLRYGPQWIGFVVFGLFVGVLFSAGELLDEPIPMAMIGAILIGVSTFAHYDLISRRSAPYKHATHGATQCPGGR